MLHSIKIYENKTKYNYTKPILLNILEKNVSSIINKEYWVKIYKNIIEEM